MHTQSYANHALQNDEMRPYEVAAAACLRRGYHEVLGKILPVAEACKCCYLNLQKVDTTWGFSGMVPIFLGQRVKFPVRSALLQSS